ncbi:glutamate-rich WD repeat containing [Exidia glandulosa HHB12029]|uniref:Glutamate-rich WD repeat-containing protein 1 n=1 Tax=Exidia glandulosa HHB12029 TaxID=1314781 RepID=A0A165IZY0_EXIGL|nr:glutamate-rich WD repeat containing [Exidia glandulosa HHB12029]
MDDEDELQFEDPWEDENDDSEEEIVDAGDDDEDEGMDVDRDFTPAAEDGEEPEPAKSVYIPGTHALAQDEVLEPDMTSYEMLHQMNIHWPCLSFDVLRDSLGDERQKYPQTAYLVAGTQADSASKNEVLVMKMSQLHRTQKDVDESDSDDDEEDEDALDEDAVVEMKSIPHQGGVNRIRAQPLPGSQPLAPVTTPYHVASWSETGKVHIWDVRPLIEALDSPGYNFESAKTPLHTIAAHGRAEGFAMDWGGDVGSSSASSLRLLTGDVASKIFLTTSTPSGFNTNANPFASHTSSVEDLQWSPTELTVFASCSADASVRIWDIRVKARKSVVGIPDAHSSDVNVISWNRSSAHLLLSGGDDGALKVWDLRSLKSATTPAPAPVASFNWHTAPITAVEWHPTDESTFAASGADDQVTLWDLAVEQDADEMKEDLDASGREVPQQLLFIHQGQSDIKEVHWHPQIPGALLTTSMDGFNIFKTISV